jgi:hypothetical protein
MFRFTIRDVLWLTVVVGLSIGWWRASRLELNQDNARKLWAFDIAVNVLRQKTGDEMTVVPQGVRIVERGGQSVTYRFADSSELGFYENAGRFPRKTKDQN